MGVKMKVRSQIVGEYYIVGAHFGAHKAFQTLRNVIDAGLTQGGCFSGDKSESQINTMFWGIRHLFSTSLKNYNMSDLCNY